MIDPTHAPPADAHPGAAPLPVPGAVHPNLAVAEAHFRAIEPELRALPPDRIATARGNVQFTAMTALAAVGRLHTTRMREGLAHTPGLLDAPDRWIERIRALAWALWFTAHRLRECGDDEADRVQWRGAQNRAWTLLVTDYDRVLRAAHFILWNDTRRDVWFPRL